MKNENDLLEDLVRYSFETSGASEAEIDLTMHQFRTQLIANLKTNPAKNLSDEEYAEKFEHMKKEVPAFLNYLMTHDFGQLPGKFLGQNN
jgi:hypothetical protein